MFSASPTFVCISTNRAQTTIHRAIVEHLLFVFSYQSHCHIKPSQHTSERVNSDLIQGCLISSLTKIQLLILSSVFVEMSIKLRDRIPQTCLATSHGSQSRATWIASFSMNHRKSSVAVSKWCDEQVTPSGRLDSLFFLAGKISRSRISPYLLTLCESHRNGRNFELILIQRSFHSHTHSRTIFQSSAHNFLF